MTACCSATFITATPRGVLAEQSGQSFIAPEEGELLQQLCLVGARGWCTRCPEGARRGDVLVYSTKFLWQNMSSSFENMQWVADQSVVGERGMRSKEAEG